MFDYMENLKIVSSFHKEGKPYSRIENRAYHGFIIKIKGSSEYVFQDKRLTLKEGEMIFLPKGATYENRLTSNGQNLYTSINFFADHAPLEPKVFQIDNFYGAQYIYQSFSEMWNFGMVSDKYKCTSIFYELISYISRIEHMDNSDKKKYHIIESAIKYLKKHVYDTTLKINRLHLACGVSDTYFRKIFVSIFNMTPQEYLVEARLSYAKSIIESGDFETIAEVAELSGYSDALYFSKAFKKKYGYPPSNMDE